MLVVSILIVAASCGAQHTGPDYAVPPPQPVQTVTRVGTYIFPGWYRSPKTNDYPYPNHDQESEWPSIRKVFASMPLLGSYDDSLPEVNDWHIKWALESGIQWFAFDWYWNQGEKRLARTLEEGFLKARYCEQMQFCINWCNHGLDWRKPLDWSPSALEEMFAYCAEHYFKRPNYMRLDGRPVFMIWDIHGVLEACNGHEAFMSNTLPQIEAVCNSRGVPRPFLVAVHNAPDRLADIRCADAITGYSYAWRTPRVPYNPPGRAPYECMIEALPSYWNDIRRAARIPFIVSTQSGWDNTPRTVGSGNPDGLWALTDNTIALFKRTLRDAKDAVDPDFPLVLIEAWNEWGEGSFIEPSDSHGFGHLSAIRRTFAPDAPSKEWDKPTVEQIKRYQVEVEH
jgi:hypothetical protein